MVDEERDKWPVEKSAENGDCENANEAGPDESGLAVALPGGSEVRSVAKPGDVPNGVAHPDALVVFVNSVKALAEQRHLQRKTNYPC